MISYGEQFTISTAHGHNIIRVERVVWLRAEEEGLSFVLGSYLHATKTMRDSLVVHYSKLACAKLC